MKNRLTKEQAVAIIERAAEKTARTAFRLRVNTDRKPGLCGSKFGGVPYWDSRQQYPELLGDAFMLLAQINLADLGKNEYLPDHGLLQFFILCDEVYGADFDRPMSGNTFRVVYHESIDPQIDEAAVLALGIPTTLDSFAPEEKPGERVFDADMPPFTGELAVDVERTVTSMGTGDFNYDSVFESAAQELGIPMSEKSSWFDLLPDEIADAECEKNTGHWMFGYPYFTQYDPRECVEGAGGHDVTLLQIDSDDTGGIMWGDCGVANLFVRSEDLRKLDFSKVLYNWDCC